LLLLFIADAQKPIVQDNEIGGVGEDSRIHTETGSHNQESLILYLHLVRRHMGGGGDAADGIYLLADIDRAHMTGPVRRTAEEPNIELMYIPATCTDEFQPLDKKVFSPFKVKAKHEQRVGLNGGNKRGKI
jgi:hypothetical protein